MEERKVFVIENGKAHILVMEDDPLTRYPLGRAKCGPIPRREWDEVIEINQITTAQTCWVCFK